MQATYEGLIKQVRSITTPKTMSRRTLLALVLSCAGTLLIHLLQAAVRTIACLNLAFAQLWLPWGRQALHQNFCCPPW